MVNLTVFTENQAEYDEIEKKLNNLRNDYSFQIFQINIHDDPVILEKYKNKTPVVMVGPYTLSAPIHVQDLRVALGAAADRVKQLNETSDEKYQKKKAKGSRVTNTDRVGYWLSRHFMVIFNLVLFLYVGLAFLAPVLMKIGLPAPAKVIYTIYSPLCHQLSFRSWFLFGEQAYYPRALAGIPKLTTYEQISGSNQIDLLAARDFIGNEAVGYKVALCERDVAIYGAMLLFGLAFSLLKNRLQPVRWYVWIGLGLIPIGVDGVSQLPGLMNRIPEWLPLRESTPLLRTMTGALFGITTAWYLFPLIEMSMRETREILVRKLSIHKEAIQSDRQKN